jgi:hypothetical protein
MHPGHKFRMFDRLVVRISVDESDQQHKKLLFQVRAHWEKWPVRFLDPIR